MTITDNFLTINQYSRPGIQIHPVKGLVIHYVANTNSSALANRNFFESRKGGTLGYGSAHYIIGIKGEVIRCLPEAEMAYHVGAKTYTPKALELYGDYPNNNTLGIECCHIKDSGEMSPETYNILVELTMDICKRFNINPLTHLQLHYDITGKLCHKWFVENPQEWEKFKNIINNNLH